MARPKKVAQELEMPAITESPAGSFRMWKPKDQEFYLESDFAAIAQQLNAEIAQVDFTWEPETMNDIDGHTLIGTLKN